MINTHLSRRYSLCPTSQEVGGLKWTFRSLCRLSRSPTSQEVGGLKSLLAPLHEGIYGVPPRRRWVD